MKGVTAAHKDKNMVVLARLDLEYHRNLYSWLVYEDLSVYDDSGGRFDEGLHHWTFENDRQTRYHLLSLHAPPFEF